MFNAQDVLNLYQRLSTCGIEVILTGGWGIDALLGRQTRPHEDLDIFIQVKDATRLRDIMGREGYLLKELWSENRWVKDEQGNRVATAFVLHDKAGRELDIHALRLDEHGNGIPAWVSTDIAIFTREALASEGIIAGFPVRCITPAMQVICHTGYVLPEKQVRDMRLLHEKD